MTLECLIVTFLIYLKRFFNKYCYFNGYHFSSALKEEGLYIWLKKFCTIGRLLLFLYVLESFRVDADLLKCRPGQQSHLHRLP